MFQYRYLPPQATATKYPALSLQLVTSRLIVNATPTTLLIDSVLQIDSAYYTYNAATGTVTFLVSGYYMISGNHQWQNNIMGARLNYGVITDGGTRLFMGFGMPALFDHATVNYLARLSGGATLTNGVYQNCGFSLNVLSGINSNLNIVRSSDL